MSPTNPPIFWLGVAIIGVGALFVLLVLIAKIILLFRPSGPELEASGFWQFMLKLAEKVDPLFIQGLLIMGLGVVVALIGGGVDISELFKGDEATPTPSASST